jgi:hypothetical protein
VSALDVQRGHSLGAASLLKSQLYIGSVKWSVGEISLTDWGGDAPFGGLNMATKRTLPSQKETLSKVDKPTLRAVLLAGYPKSLTSEEAAARDSEIAAILMKEAKARGWQE